MKVSYTWLQKFFDKKLPKADILAELINSHVFEVESVENVGKDTVMDLKIMPDRAHHALCHRGIVREVSAIANIPLGMSKEKELVKEDINIGRVSVSVQTPELCRRYIARRIDAVKIVPSPADLATSLNAVDSRAINNIVDATNYVMLDLGQPLHAFDADKIDGGIIVRLARKGEKIELLPERVTSVDDKGCPVIIEKERVLELTDNDLIIADNTGPIAIAGVKGGNRAEISEHTRNIILESANFDPVSIRRTATRLNIRNDSSKRFENEIIPELAGEAMDSVVSLILNMNKGARVGPQTDVWHKKTSHRKISLETSFISEKLGMKISDKEIISILERYDCKVSSVGTIIEIITPLDRLDIVIKEDIVDEIARVKGYDALPSVLPPRDVAPVNIDTGYYLAEKIKNILKDNDFTEVMLYSLVSKGHFEIVYPLAKEKAAMRESILPKLQEALNTNLLNADLLGLEQIRIYEIGKVFPSTGEKTVLSIGIALTKKKKGITADGILKEILTRLETEYGLLAKGTSNVGITVKGNLACAELDLTPSIEQLARENHEHLLSDLDIEFLSRDKQYTPFSHYPFIVRDVALFVPSDIDADGVWKVVEKGIKNSKATELLVRHSLFDTFSKDGKRSYAFRLVFQSKERTLTDEEVNIIMQKIYDFLKGAGWEVR